MMREKRQPATVADLIDDYIADMSVTVKPSTLRIYRGALAHVARVVGGCSATSGVTPEVVERCVESLRGVVMPATLHRVVSRLKSVVRWSESVLGLPAMPWPRLRLPRVPSVSRPRHYDRRVVGQLARLMESDPDPRLLAMMVCLTCGLRPGEVLALRWGDVDLRCGLITVERTLARVSPCDGLVDAAALARVSTGHSNGRQAARSVLVVQAPKTGTSLRWVPIVPELARWCRPFKRKCTGTDYIATGTAYVLDFSTFRAYHDHVLKSLGVRPLNLHCMRHTCATQLLQSGCDEATVAGILGHKSPATTLNVYCHTDNTAMRRAARRAFGATIKRKIR